MSKLGFIYNLWLKNFLIYVLLNKIGIKLFILVEGEAFEAFLYIVLLDRLLDY